MDITAIYKSASRHGLTVNATAGNITTPVMLSNNDKDIFGGKGSQTDYLITYPSGALALVSGQGIVVDGVNYTVRGNPTLINRGAEVEANLSKSA